MNNLFREFSVWILVYVSIFVSIYYMWQNTNLCFTVAGSSSIISTCTHVEVREVTAMLYASNEMASGVLFVTINFSFYCKK